MATQRQIDANRRNAQKSTGPRTAAGKARARLNPLKHGLTAQTVVLPFESAADFETLRDDVLQDLQPRSTTQQILVERFVHKHWLSLRVARAERGLLQILYENQLAEGTHGAARPKAQPDPAQGLALCMLNVRPQDPPGSPAQKLLPLPHPRRKRLPPRSPLPRTRQAPPARNWLRFVRPRTHPHPYSFIAFP